MVGRAYFPGENDEMPTLRRYSSRGGNGYPLSDERELPPSLRHDLYNTSRPPHHESRTSDRRSPENDSATRPRSRIPVACGRCRKRKIKCSGDNGGPCTNCKQAQHDQCQFLRVSSMDAQLKTEAPYEYDQSVGAGSRLSCRGPFYPQHYVQPSPLGVETGYSYRNNSLPAYPFQQKSYYPATSFTEYGDGGIDYDLQGSTYQLLSTENLGMPSNYTTSGTARGWNTAAQYHRNSLFIEQSETPYSQVPMQYGSVFPIRAAINPDSRNMSLSTMSLPALTPISAPLTTDRLLPIPPTQRQTHVPFNRPTDLGTTVNPGSQPAYQSYQGDFMRSSLKSQNMQAVSENGSLASSYLPMPSSSPESMASSQITYGTQQMSMSQQQQNEIYTPSSTDGLYQNESSDSSYGHSSNGSKRGSQSSQTTSTDALLPPIATDTLANGQRYVPYEAPNYPVPPSGAMTSNISPGGRALHHSSVTVDN